MAKPTPLSGFPELLPEQRFVEQQVIDTLRTVFELHGFAGIETRAVEPMDQLLRKGDTSKEVYVLRRLQETDTAADSGLGLHFDLTVPFARFVLENAGKLEFPFRRYQVQKAWRGERPQDGRYREFTQADIDIVGKDELPFHHDIEVTRVMVDALSRLTDPAVLGLPPFRLQVNNRKLIQGFYAGLGAPDPAEVMRLVDKLDKLPAETVRGMLLEEAGLSPEQADRCLELATIRSTDDSFVDRVRALGVEDPLLEEGLTELAALLRGCASLTGDQVTIEADLSIARGLDYYTGTVFETRLEGSESLGSICSGGRYDALASDGRTTYPGVGISLGVSRVLVPLLNRGALVADRKVPSVVLVALTGEDTREESDAIATALRANGVPCEVAATAQKFGKQIRYAERRGIPYVWFTGDDGHQVKDIRTGEQVAADPATWTPPAADHRPRVVVATGSTTPPAKEQKQ
ncbi:histidine--tRNA ligase [Nocardioides sp. zg-579]|uniref:Histidine--tRNA ligase n=1 Tax=Nocardioides marmotae TaxID=2663857 RepID=A0A6I3JH56_9ACTN|nr:histidine--tRNA ligase [Nocardioides marmotae]MCR6033762.1 histidine--tRNA ligase [Gordonia jinghuaiqii]MTB97420.1 histidine--tRNA ligase [Nocardioides marmotae]QKE01758.1 histidine--tRNA ligase [Nocardioides marmotae]